MGPRFAQVQLDYRSLVGQMQEISSTQEESGRPLLASKEECSFPRNVSAQVFKAKSFGTYSRYVPKCNKTRNVKRQQFLLSPVGGYLRRYNFYKREIGTQNSHSNFKWMSHIVDSAFPLVVIHLWDKRRQAADQPRQAWTWDPLLRCCKACVCVKSLQACLTLSEPMDCSLPGSSVHGILWARIQEWVAMPSSEDLSDPAIEPVTQGSNLHLLCLLHWQADSLPVMPPGKS